MFIRMAESRRPAFQFDPANSVFFEWKASTKAEVLRTLGPLPACVPPHPVLEAEYASSPTSSM
ncbi:hypothetical protein BH09VER1_BH09VER1_51960 [soil metagenome]